MMLEQCIDIFLEENKKQVGKLIVNEYRLADGNYYFIDIAIGKVIESLLVDKNTDVTTELYYQFKQRDYLSKLLEMNKPIDSSKQIHSNNYRSFFIKKEKLKIASKKILKSVNGYYDVFRDYSKKYDAPKMALLESLNLSDSSKRQDEIDKIRTWLVDNFDKLDKLEKFKDDKNYIKLFFVNDKRALSEDSQFHKSDMDSYRSEANKYIIPNIYNKNQYNITKNNQIYGPPNDNFGLNDKKPYIKHRSRKSKVAILLNKQDVNNQKLFFDYLFSLASQKKYNVYIGQTKTEDNEIVNAICAYSNNQFHRDVNFNGYYLRLAKEKNEAEIVDIDVVSKLSISNTKLKISDYLMLKGKARIEDYYKESRINIDSAISILDKALFGNRLMTNLFSDASNVCSDDLTLKWAILKLRPVLIDWLYKGKKAPSYQQFERLTDRLILRHLEKNQFVSFVNAYNVQKSMIEFLIAENSHTKGGTLMSEEMLWQSLKQKINCDEKLRTPLESDAEFCFALGQLWRFLLSKSEVADKNYAMLMPLLSAKKVARMQQLTENLLIKYAHAISTNSARCNNLVANVLLWKSEHTVVDNKMILAGFATQNLIYLKDAEEE